MLSKHQQVQMLEVRQKGSAVFFLPRSQRRTCHQAAAILVNPGSLPEEKSLWPAAVSPPSSGLLGSDQLNAEVLRQHREASWQPELHEGEVDEEESESGDDMDVDARQATNDNVADGDGEEMFALDFGPSASSGEERDSGYASGSVRGDSTATLQQHGEMGEDSKVKALGNMMVDYRQQFEPTVGQGRQGVAMAVSAPIMGFFDQRPRQPPSHSVVMPREKREISADAMEE
jgi:hypothetical protein